VSRASAPAALHVTRQLGNHVKVRKCTRINNISPNVVVQPFNNDIATLERAVLERVFNVKHDDGSFGPPPKPAPGVFSGRMVNVLNQLRPFLPSTAPMTFDEFVDSFKGRKKRRYAEALKQLRETGSSVSEDAKVQVFVKYEKTDRTSKADPVPRVISPRDPKFNLRVGRYLRPIEEKLFDSLGELFGHRTVFKGMDNTTVATTLREKWDMFRKPVAIGLDASRFDQHVSLDALKFEHSVYPLCFEYKTDRNKLRSLLKHQLVNRCSGYTADGSLKYEIEGTRMSGDMNTSLGNCVLMCMMIKAYSDAVGVVTQLANNGDDCVVFMEEKDLGKFSFGLKRWFMEMGFNMQVEAPSYEFEHIEFCQTRPVFDGSEWVMSRNPLTAIIKDSVMLKNPDSYHMMFPLWMKSVGVGGIKLAGKLPIFQSFYKMYERSGADSYRRGKGSRGKQRFADSLSEDLLPWYMREHQISGSRTVGEISPECRASFYTAWGVTPCEQIALESYYDAMTLSQSIREGEFEPRSVFTEVEDCV